MKKFVFSLIVILMSPLAVGEITEPKASVVNMNSIEPFIYSDIVIRSVVANTVRLTQLEMKKGIKSPSHNHPDEEIFFLLEGQVRAISGDDSFIMMPGDVFLVPSFVPHQIEAIVDSVIIEAGGPGPMLGRLHESTE